MTASSVAIGVAATKKQSSTPQTAQCQTPKDFSESFIQAWPQPFENGCAISTPLRANNPSRIVYVLVKECDRLATAPWVTLTATLRPQ